MWDGLRSQFVKAMGHDQGSAGKPDHADKKQRSGPTLGQLPREGVMGNDEARSYSAHDADEGNTFTPESKRPRVGAPKEAVISEQQGASSGSRPAQLRSEVQPSQNPDHGQQQLPPQAKIRDETPTDIKSADEQPTAATLIEKANKRTENADARANHLKLELTRARDELEDQKRVHANGYQGFQQAVHRKDARIRSLKFDIQSLQAKIQERDEEADKQDTKIVKLEKDIRMFQDQAGRNIEPAQLKPESAVDIAHRLDGIYLDIRRWAQRHIAKDRISWSDLKAIEATLHSVGLDVGLGLLDLGPNEQSAMNAKAPLVVSAVLASIAFHCITGNAFFAFRNDNDTANNTVFHERIAIALSDLRHASRGADSAAENAWRRQLLRSLEPVAASKDEGTLPMKHATMVARTAAAERLAEICVRGLNALLASPQGGAIAAQSGLSSIYTKCAEDAGKMWLQHSSVETHGFRQMASSQDLFYRAEEPELDWLQLHPQHERLVDDNPAALDGFPVRLIISPAVAMVGNADGSKPDELTVLKKAIVWLGEGSDGVKRVEEVTSEVGS